MRFRAYQRLGAVLALSLAAQSCGIKLVDLGPAPNIYDVSPKAHFEQQFTAVTWQLVVAEPTVSSALDTDRILVRPSPNEIRYFAEARWAERAPRILQSRLVEAFEQSGAIVGVGRQAIGLRADYQLQGSMSSFDAVYSGGSTPMIEISYTAKLVRQPSSIIIASRTFEGKERASDASMRAIAASYENVLGNILSDVVPWTLSEAQKDYEQRPQRYRSKAPRARPGGP